MKGLVVALCVVGSRAATELTPENWDSEIAGRSAFIKFLAPW